jgi:TRAP-type C4-dicarboxylate transport system permease large subunit
MGASLFAAFVWYSGAPLKLISFIAGTGVNRYVVLASIAGIFLILGCVMDAIGIMLLTLPIVFPVIVELGFDPIWFGVVQLMLLEIGFLTPPVGLNVFVIHGVAPHLSLGEIFRGASWFAGIYAIVTIFIVVFPQIATWLPSRMFVD